jgi:hypothetical protein
MWILPEREWRIGKNAAAEHRCMECYERWRHPRCVRPEMYWVPCDLCARKATKRIEARHRVAYWQQRKPEESG